MSSAGLWGCVTTRSPAVTQPPRIISPTAAKPLAAREFYTVVRGDNLYRLAQRFETTVDALCRLNQLVPSAVLRTGMRLKIRNRVGQSLARMVTLRWPARGQVTTGFGVHHGRPHDGIDIFARQGVAVLAAADGDVVFAEFHGSYGKLLIVRHSSDLMTVYAHCEETLVKKGERVRCGEVIGRVGQSQGAVQRHLHFEVRRGTRPEDPLSYLPP